MGDAHDLPLDRLEAWLRGHVEGFRGPIAAQRFTGGQSNPTYRLQAASGLYVLRRKPPGPLLPSAHAVERDCGAFEQIASPSQLGRLRARARRVGIKARIHQRTPVTIISSYEGNIG